MNMSNKQKAEIMKKNYSIWKENSINESGFFVLFNGFVDSGLLRKINGNALKLYIFFGVKSDNSTGESFYSISSLAKYFKKSEKTISNWIKELERLNLICRLQLNYNQVSHTFLQTYPAGRRKK